MEEKKDIKIMQNTINKFDRYFCKDHNCSDLAKVKRIFQEEYEEELQKYASGKLKINCRFL